MQVNASHKNDAFSRLKSRLKEQAASDRDRASTLESEAAKDQFQAGELQEDAADNRSKGEQLKSESNRLRRNGRDQSRRGLERLVQGSERYAESFQGQEKGLGDLKESLDGMEAAGQSKEKALEKIHSGLDEQKAHNDGQQTDLNTLSGINDQNGQVIEGKQDSVKTLGQNISARRETLNDQTGKVADFIIAGGDYSEASVTKQEGVREFKTAVGHRVEAEALGDAKSEKEVQKQWAEQDADRHHKADNRLTFGSIIEDLKARAAGASARFHEASAVRGEQEAGRLSQAAAEMRAQADIALGNARSLEHCGQHHVAIGRQMQCNPWTYCQGVHLEQRGHCEIAEAQRLKAQAQNMRAQAQEKALEAEEARVKAEQARSVSEDFEVTAHGSRVRSDLLSKRADDHEQRAHKAEAYAEKAGQEADKLGQAASQQMSQAREHHQQGSAKFEEGMTAQKAALNLQQQAVEAFDASVADEKELQKSANDEVKTLGGALLRGRSFLSRSGSLYGKLNTSVQAEKLSQQKVAEGIDDYQGGLNESKESNQKGREAANLLSEARELELEGLRLQNRGQKMLLEARPKMAQAAKLSAESFDAFKKADKQDLEAHKLIEQGAQKLQAAEILREKAESYEKLAGKA